MHSFLIYFYVYMHECFACRYVCVRVSDVGIADNHVSAGNWTPILYNSKSVLPTTDPSLQPHKCILICLNIMIIFLLDFYFTFFFSLFLSHSFIRDSEALVTFGLLFIRNNWACRWGMYTLREIWVSHFLGVSDIEAWNLSSWVDQIPHGRYIVIIQSSHSRILRTD